MLGGRARGGPLDDLTSVERDILGPVAEGQSNAAIAAGLALTESVLERQLCRIFAELDLPPTATGHRRVLAVLEYLRVLEA